MMIATNWGVFEIGERQPEFIEEGDTRELQVRARDAGHLDALRERIPGLGETVFLDGIADFPYRAYVARDVLGMGMWDLVFGVDYIQFKKGALKDGRLHTLLSRMWSSWLDAYPKHSIYTRHTETRPHRETRRGRMNWYEDIQHDISERRRNGLD